MDESAARRMPPKEGLRRTSSPARRVAQAGIPRDRSSTPIGRVSAFAAELLGQTRLAGSRQGGVSAVAAWRQALPALFAIFLVSRLALVALAAIGELARPVVPSGILVQTSTPLLRELTSWDGVHYVSIALNGYGPLQPGQLYPEYVFFPLLPMVMAGLHVVTRLPMDVLGLAVANVSFGLALVVIYRLGEKHLGHERALLACTLLAFGPGAAAFGMVYSDSLFLLLVALAFAFAEERRDGAAAVCYALATLSRLPGIVIGLPLLVLLMRRDGRNPTIRWAMLAAGPLALAGFYGFLGVVVGDPLANLHGQGAWDQPANFATPLIGVELAALVLLFLVIMVAWTIIGLRQMVRVVPPAYAAYALSGVIVVILALRVASLPRYLIVLFPITWGLASFPPGRSRNIVSASWVGLFVFFSLFAFGFGFPP